MHLNYFQNMWLMSLFVNTPLLLRFVHQLVVVKQGIPLPPTQSNYLGLFFFLQLVYDWCVLAPAFHPPRLPPLPNVTTRGADRVPSLAPPPQVLVHPTVQVAPELHTQNPGP